jgi:hypothetical protein
LESQLKQLHDETATMQDRSDQRQMQLRIEVEDEIMRAQEGLDTFLKQTEEWRSNQQHKEDSSSSPENGGSFFSH